MTTGLASVSFFVAQVRQAGSNLGQARFQITLNSPSAGSVTIKIMQQDYDKLTAIGSPTGLPAGVSLRSTSGGTADTTSHVHDMSHDHAVTPASSTQSGANAFTLALALQPNVTTHTHTLNLPNHVQNTGANTSHTHTWDSLYQHQQSLTNTATDIALVELANGTNLVTTKINYLAADG